MSRQAFVDWAVAEIGKATPEKLLRYFREAIGREPTEAELKKSWCGIFALCGLHEVGLAKDVLWQFGRGFLLQPPHPLPFVKIPEPGDIGYLDKPFQHHFVVEAVDGALVHSIDGNQPDVRRKTRSLSPSLAFFSIQPFLEIADREPVLPGQPPRVRHTGPAEVQHAVNSLIMKHLADEPPTLLTVDGKIGPKSQAAIRWAQRALGIAETGNPDAATCAALGLS